MKALIPIVLAILVSVSNIPYVYGFKKAYSENPFIFAASMSFLCGVILLVLSLFWGRIEPTYVVILLDGSFVDRRENLLAFGNPGSGKTHLLCGICHELARQGRRIYFSTCDLIVQQLLRAKRELELDKLLKKLSRFEALMIDDFGYVKQDRDEMEVLFTLLAHRYERGSMLLTSNLPFSKWEVIFKDPMTTAAAIDRLVHHSVVLELNVPSYRAEQAKKRRKINVKKSAPL